MSEKRKKVIHVDKLIVKADEVIVMPERKHHHRRNPWGLGMREGLEDVHEEEHIDVHDEKVEDVEEDIEDKRKRRSPWL